MPIEHRVRKRDGGTLRVQADGDPDGLPVLLHHGTPGDASLYGPHVADARERGLLLVAYDRPGYAGSTAAPGRTVADCARDVAAIADELGFGRFAVAGGSGGGPHALACGALLPDRVLGVACLASVAPADADGLDWTAGMGDENVAELEAAQSGRETLAPLLASLRDEMLALTAEQLRAAFPTLLSAVDVEVLTGDFAEFVHSSIGNALATDAEGWIEDDLALVDDWGFDVADVAVPVLLWHGEHDRFVPFAHGRWLATRLPDVEPHLSADDGHLTLGARRIPEVHAWLAERLQA